MRQTDHAQRRLAKIAEWVAIKPKATITAAKPAGAAKDSVNDKVAAGKRPPPCRPWTRRDWGLGDLASLISSGLRRRDEAAAPDLDYLFFSVEARCA
jgi:hypothetical protein